MTDKQLSVRLHGHPVGTLRQDETGRMSFAYLPEASAPVSLGMPVREEPYDHARCVAYFGGLLPESDEARRAIARRFGVSPNNDFSLLKVIGYDCAGAVSLHAPDEPVADREAEPLVARQLDEGELAAHIRELPRKPLFLGVDGLRLSLAGAQEKAAVCLDGDGKIALPQDGSPTTHILKPAIDRLEDTVQNEYFCMRLARRLGIDTPEVTIRRAEDVPFLLVARYDREQLPGGRLRRVHQEDFCQALGVASALKYQADGGPGFRECFDLLRQASRPVPDRNRLAELVVFNYLIGNRDAHGKNFSLLHPRPGTVQMAPAYDLLCAGIYDEHGDRMAMKVGGYYEESKIQPRHWERLCKEVGFAYPAMRKILQRQTRAILPAAEAERAALRDSGFSARVGDRILAFLEARCERVQTRFEW